MDRYHGRVIWDEPIGEPHVTDVIGIARTSEIEDWGRKQAEIVADLGSVSCSCSFQSPPEPDYDCPVHFRPPPLSVDVLAIALRAMWSEDPDYEADADQEHDYALGLVENYVKEWQARQDSNARIWENIKAAFPDPDKREKIHRALFGVDR